MDKEKKLELKRIRIEVQIPTKKNQAISLWEIERKNK